MSSEEERPVITREQFDELPYPLQMALVAAGVVPKKSDKLKTSIALDTELVNWIDGEIQKKRFANRSHAIEYALEKLRSE